MRLGLWFIERKVPEQVLVRLQGRPCPWKSPRGLDLYDGFREGYQHILSVHPSLLNWPTVQPTLAESDMHRIGGAKEVNRKLDEADERWEQQTDKVISDYNESAALAMHDDLAWALGNRMAVTEPARPGLREGTFEQRDGFVIRDRRVTA